MPRCFVIQPFDNGKFDKRYVSTVRPAIEAAGLDPYRVDQDPSVAVPVEDIEAGIRGATIRALLEQEFVTPVEVQSWNETYPGFSLTAKGFKWLNDNKNLLTLRVEPKSPPAPSGYGVTPSDDDDIPF